MITVGLCGGSGSGKGIVSQILSSYGFSIIDTDAIYHSLTSKKSECLEALRLEFGDEIIKDGALCRPILAKIVFDAENAEERRRKLNQISHAFVMKEVHKQIDSYRKDGRECCIVDIPLLYETGFDKECDLTVAVIADKETRIKRIIARDGISQKAAEQRVDSQIPNETLIELSDTHITNMGDISLLDKEVCRIIELINKVKDIERIKK